MTLSQGNVGCLIARTTLGYEGKLFQNRIEYLLNKNGVEWTNNRLKVLWNAALLLRNGDAQKVIDLYQQNSIAYNKNTLMPKGPEGIPVKRFVTAQRPAVIKRQAAVLRFYCSLTLDKVSDKQRQKALTAICGASPCNREEAYISGMAFTNHLIGERRIRVKSLKDKPMAYWEVHAEHLRGTSKYYSRYKVPKELRGKPYSSMAMSLMTEPWVPGDLDKETPCYEMRELIRNDSWSDENPQQFAGKITFLQEQGCKARVVCQPSAWLQLAFMPLHNRLHRIANQLFPKESCVDDQVRGAYTMMAHLRSGRSVFCTDLSSATDRFPRAFSEGVLSCLGYEPYANALEEVCQRKFRCDEHPEGYVKYAVGQPMGLYGSFPLFHLSNMLVAYEAMSKVRAELGEIPGTAAYYHNQANKLLGKSTPEPLVDFGDGTYFRTVGDDIIFSDGRISDRYCQMMRDFGVEISEPKSFSGSVAEFAGFIGLRTNKSVAVFRPYKVPADRGKHTTINNAIQFLDAMGAHARNIKGWEKRFNQFLETRSYRDLALSPCVSFNDERRMAARYKADTPTLMQICTQLAWVSTDPLPDLSGNSEINSKPLFRERGPVDFIQYEEKFLRLVERDEQIGFRNGNASFSKDPLIKEVRDLESGRKLSPTVLTHLPNRERETDGIKPLVNNVEEPTSLSKPNQLNSDMVPNVTPKVAGVPDELGSQPVRKPVTQPKVTKRREVPAEMLKVLDNLNHISQTIGNDQFDL